MESIGQLAGGVAHDFNNILTVIQCHVALLEQDPAITSDIADSIKEIGEAATSATSLTRQLLAFSRRQLMQVKPIDLAEILNVVTKMLRRVLGENVELAVETCPCPAIAGDAGMMEQVIMNLAINARDAMPKGGSLRLCMDLQTLDENPAAPQAKARGGRFVRLSVIDTGVGIPPEYIEKIFEPFFTTKEVGKGTGLGLATVYGIVTQHGGFLEVTSHVGRGTRFDVYFPVCAAAARTELHRPALAAIAGKGTILLVEDDTALRELTRTVLSRRGYDVIAADCGSVALSEFEHHRDRIDLMITDMVLPGELTGRELGRRLRIKQPPLRVLYMSGYRTEEIDRVEELEMEKDFLQKPFTPTVLLEAVHRALQTTSRQTSR
jgi:CheY-like chemotaxis protein